MLYVMWSELLFWLRLLNLLKLIPTIRWWNKEKNIATTYLVYIGFRWWFLSVSISDYPWSTLTLTEETKLEIYNGSKMWIIMIPIWKHHLILGTTAAQNVWQSLIQNFFIFSFIHAFPRIFFGKVEMNWIYMCKECSVQVYLVLCMDI